MFLIPQVVLLQAHFLVAHHKLPHPERPLVPFHNSDTCYLSPELTQTRPSHTLNSWPPIITTQCAHSVPCPISFLETHMEHGGSHKATCSPQISKQDTHLYAISILRGPIGLPLIIISLCILPGFCKFRFSASS